LAVAAGKRRCCLALIFPDRPGAVAEARWTFAEGDLINPGKYPPDLSLVLIFPMIDKNLAVF
jgi:hypothetical protein